MPRAYRRRNWGHSLLVLSTGSILFITLAARLGRWHWSADLLALFHDGYFVVSLGLVVLSLLVRRPLWAGVAGLALLVNGWLLFPYLPVATATAGGSHNLRLYVHNLYYLNDDPEAALTNIAAHDPDVVFLMEYSGNLQERLEPHLSAYPYQLIEPSRFTMGLALFSRVPFGEARVRRFEETRIPIFEVALDLGGREVGFVGGHPWPPLGRWGALHRAQMADIAEVAAEASPPLIVAGDFNASPWSFAVGNLRRTAGLRDAQRGFGLRKTWWLNRLFALPIDGVLVSEEWRVHAFEQGERGGSDHVPLVVDLALEGLE